VIGLGRAVRPSQRVVVVGAGIAGLTAARSLSRSFDVTVVDKGRKVGGRLASRRIGDATFDHGAQFITTHTPEFAQAMAGWERAGVARRWFQGQIGSDGVIDVDGHTRFRGVATMRAIAEHVAVGLDVRVFTRVVAVEPSDSGWRIRLEDDSELVADGVLLTAPVPQSLDLLAAGAVQLSPADGSALRALTYEPCLAVLAALDGASGLDEPGAIRPSTGPIDWMADNHLKGVSAIPAVTIHAAPEFSRTHWEASDEKVVAELVGSAALSSGLLDDQAHVQRWRFARPTAIHQDRCLVAEGVPPLVFAGDAFGGAKVEGAVLSGTAASEALASLLGRRAVSDGRPATSS
jgi:renalase